MANKESLPTKKQIAEWKEKSEKWDALGKKIAKFYVGEEGDELEVNEDSTTEGDLGDIGEVAANAFGWL